jgi:AraC-like DNA-binding protein
VGQAPYLFPTGSRFGTDNLVLHARATHHRVEGFSGPSSIKTVIAGEVAWVVSGRQLLVDPSTFLVLSAGEIYSMNVAAKRPVETCCVFFAAGFIEQLAVDITLPLENAFNIEPNATPALPYLSALHNDHDRSTLQRVQNLVHRCADGLAPSVCEEQFVDLGTDLLHLYQRIREQVSRLSAARSSTRQELHRRLLIGREYLHSQASGPISLASVARTAGLSLFHFHRGFTKAFQQTPHSYLTQLRLARARHLIETGSSVLHACLDVGFSSPSAFSRLFKSHYGAPPSSVLRNLARSGKNSDHLSGTLSA